MKKIIFELRLGIFIWILGMLISLVPKEATKTLIWLMQIPLDELKETHSSVHNSPRQE